MEFIFNFFFRCAPHSLIFLRCNDWWLRDGMAAGHTRFECVFNRGDLLFWRFPAVEGKGEETPFDKSALNILATFGNHLPLTHAHFVAHPSNEQKKIKVFNARSLRSLLSIYVLWFDGLIVHFFVNPLVRFVSPSNGLKWFNKRWIFIAWSSVSFFYAWLRSESRRFDSVWIGSPRWVSQLPSSESDDP